MAVNTVEFLPIATLFVGIILSLAEAGLFWFILHFYGGGNKKLGLLFSFTLLWVIFLVVQEVAYHVGSEIMKKNAYLLGGVLLLIVLTQASFRKKYQNRTLLSMLIIAFIAFVIALGVDYRFDEYHTLSAFLLIIPPIMGYILFMKETLRMVE